MKRRDFLITGASLILATPALAATGARYTTGLVDKELAAGNTVFVDFYTDWCTTCRAQGAAIRKLRSENPIYDAHLTFIAVDFDQHRASALSRRLQIPRRSTLVVLKGEAEIGRIVANTRRAAIQELMDAGVAAATA